MKVSTKILSVLISGLCYGYFLFYSTIPGRIFMNNKNIIKCYDVFDDYNNCYFIYEYIQGCDLKKYTKTATTLIVAQRINTIKNADKIIVLDNGKMVGIGTHEELLKNNQVYREIADSQNKGDN